MEYRKTLVTRYNLPNLKVSNQFKICYGFLIYPPLQTSHLATMLYDIGNRSIAEEHRILKIAPCEATLTVHKPNTNFGRFSKLESTHNVFWCFQFLSKVLFTNMEGEITIMLRKSFQGLYIICAYPAS